MITGCWRSLAGVVAALLVAFSTPGLVRASSAGPPRAAPARQATQGIDVEVIGDVIVGRPVEIEVRAANPAADASQGSITVSLPGNPNVEIVRASADGAKIYRPGDQMYNFQAGRATPISVEAVELFVSSWPTGTRHTLRLRVTSSSPYTVQARASFRRSDGSFVHLPAAGQADQQGAPTRLIDIVPRQPFPPTSAVPPTPPPTPAPPPTRTPAPAPTSPPPTRAEPTPGPAPQKPEQTAPTAAPSRTPVAAGPASVPPATPTLAAQPTPPPSGDQGGQDESGPSVPMLLAGFGIMGVGLAIGLVALVLVLRRRSDGPLTAQYPPGVGVTPPATAPYGPSGTERFQGAAGGPAQGGYGPPFGSPPWGQPGPESGANQGWAPASWPGSGTTSGQDLPRTAPWQESGGWGAAPAADARPSSGSQPAGSQPTDSLGASPARQGQTGNPFSPSPFPSDARQPDGGVATPPPEGRYTQRQLVGRGGMGSVYRAYDSRLRRWVALKIMHADLGSQPGFIDRFIREAQVAAMLEHPNIVTVYDIEPVGDSIQMVMSWIEGEDLQKILERDGPLRPERAAHLLDQMAAALDHAHLREHPVLHRDIKPSNIMVGPGERVILTDFGIARIMGDVSLTQAGQVVGTPAFMAPEVIQGQEADARADIYALGVVLYQMLTGRAPFRAETPFALLHAQVHTPPPPARTVLPSLPPAIDGVLMRALAKDRSERFQTAGALARALRSAIGMA